MESSWRWNVSELGLAHVTPDELNGRGESVYLAARELEYPVTEVYLLQVKRKPSAAWVTELVFQPDGRIVLNLMTRYQGRFPYGLPVLPDH